MEKIAIISDVHGNLPALEAVLTDIRKRSISRIICLGDLVGKGPNSAEAIDICREQCDIIVIGNWDKYLANNDEPGDVAWHRDQIGKERLTYLKELPESVGFYMSGRYVRLFHAHPHDVFKRVLPYSPIEEREAMFEVPKIKAIDKDTCPSDIVGYGDIHQSYTETLSGGKILFNVGSVGNPCDHIPLASYAVLEGYFNSTKISDFSIQFQRVSYDILLATQQARRTNLPSLDIYITELTTAVYGRKKK